MRRASCGALSAQCGSRPCACSMRAFPVGCTPAHVHSGTTQSARASKSGRRSIQIVCSAAGSSRQAASLPEPQAAGALVRRPSPQPVPQEVLVDMSQVVGKQVITRTTGRDLGTVSTMWVDPRSCEVVSLDLDDKKGMGSTRVANIYLSRLTQIGDVVLVHDEQVLYDQPLDGRYGFLILLGMEVRTRSGDFLGKVRDFAFSPDTGALSKIMYDDFGLSFLPVTFFDTFSISMSDVVSIGISGVAVADEAKYRERKETSGLFAAIPSLLRTLNSSSRSQPAGLLGSGTSESYRQQDGYLPQGYTYNQWESDVRRWEQETGLNYDQYIRTQASNGRPSPRQLAAGGPAGPQQAMQQSVRGAMQQPMRGAMQQPMQQPMQQQRGSMPMQQPSQGRPAPMQQSADPRFAGGVDPRFRAGAPTSPSSPYAPAEGSPARGRPPQQQQQQPMQGMRAPQQQQPGKSPQRTPMQQQPLPQQPASQPQAQGSGASGRDGGEEGAASESTGRRMEDWLAPGAPRPQEELAMEQAPGAGWPERQQQGQQQANKWGGYYGQQPGQVGNKPFV